MKFEEALRQLKRKVEQLNLKTDVILSEKETSEMKEVSCQTGEEEYTRKDQPKKMSGEGWEKKVGKKARKRSDLKVLGVKNEDNEVTSMVGILVAHTKVVAKMKKSLKVDRGMLLQLKA